MKLSFVVPAFNNHNRLRTCLSSLLDQTYPANEIEIIVADNSIDMLEAILNKELCEMSQRITYVYTADRTIIEGPHVRCLYTATEIGVERATGEWLSFPNQDTAHVPVFAARMLDYAEKQNLDLVYCDFVLGGPKLEYSPRAVSPHNCSCDKTCFIMRREWFQGFDHKVSDYHTADGFLLESLVDRGIRHGRLAECLVMHN